MALKKKRKSALPTATVVFLGAGASASDGGPLQTALFRDFFRALRTPGRRVDHQWDRELATFFLDFFGINVDQDDLAAVAFPTFEEVLGVLELAESQTESFRGWGTSHLVTTQAKPRVQHVRDLLILLIAEVLDAGLQGGHDNHGHLLAGLKGTIKFHTFISLNYDILIDNALLQLYPQWHLDYACEFTNYEEGTWSRPRKSRSVRLLKLHGSLNWLFCPTCRTLPE